MKCNITHPSHTSLSCVIIDSSLNPPGLFLQLYKCWTLIMCVIDKIPLYCKNSMVPDLWFSPRIKILWGPEVFQAIRSRSSRWVLLLGKPQGTLSLFGTPISAPTGGANEKAAILPQPPPAPLTPPFRGRFHLRCPVTYFLVLFLPDQKREIQKERLDVSFSHLIKTCRWLSSSQGIVAWVTKY